MPRNHTKSNSRDPVSNVFDLRYDEIKGISLSSLQHLFRQRAWEAWNIHKNEKEAIFHQASSFHVSCLSYCDCKNADFQEYLDQLTKEMSSYNTVDKNSVFNTTAKYPHYDNINKYLDKINTTCRTVFPKEWTVIQLLKNYNPLALSSKYEEIVNFNTGISMTIFKHSAVKDMVMIDLMKPQFTDNIFEKAYKLNKIIVDNVQQQTTDSQNPAEVIAARERYLKGSAEIDRIVQEIINILTSFFGPWIVCLTGNFKSRKSLEIENEIRKKVMEFLNGRANKFTDYQEKLIHLIARRTDLLAHQQIFVAITYILQDKTDIGYNDVDLNDIYDLLTYIKQEYKYDDTSTYPCILIIDQLLDQLPFEMINTNQEFTRICSFNNLIRLWMNYCNSTDSNGYIISPITNCQALVNPDKTLNAMEDRLKKFYTYWLPTWKVIYGEKPLPEDYSKMLLESDVLVYSGHGNGLSFLADNIFTLKTNAVLFLLGCSSVALYTSGLNSNLLGAHNYYHLGNSPCVIGFLWTVSDFPTDLCSTRILSSWIPSNAKPHWYLIDKNLWKKNNTLTFNRVCEIIASPNLPEIITKMRTDLDISITLRSALIYRGIPVVAASN